MRQQQNQTYDQKKGSADQCTTGEKQGMPGGSIGRGEMGMDSSGTSTGSNNTRNAGSGRSDHGGSEGNSRERKTARNGSDSNES